MPSFWYFQTFCRKIDGAFFENVEQRGLLPNPGRKGDCGMIVHVHAMLLMLATLPSVSASRMRRSQKLLTC